MKLIGLFVLYNPPASNSNYKKKKQKQIKLEHGLTVEII